MENRDAAVDKELSVPLLWELTDARLPGEDWSMLEWTRKWRRQTFLLTTTTMTTTTTNNFRSLRDSLIALVSVAQPLLARVNQIQDPREQTQVVRELLEPYMAPFSAVPEEKEAIIANAVVQVEPRFRSLLLSFLRICMRELNNTNLKNKLQKFLDLSYSPRTRSLSGLHTATLSTTPHVSPADPSCILACLQTYRVQNTDQPLPLWLEQNSALPNPVIRREIMRIRLERKPPAMPKSWTLTTLSVLEHRRNFVLQELHDPDLTVQLDSLTLFSEHGKMGTSSTDTSHRNSSLLLYVLCFYAVDIRLPVRMHAMQLLGNLASQTTRVSLQQILQLFSKKPISSTNTSTTTNKHPGQKPHGHAAKAPPPRKKQKLMTDEKVGWTTDGPDMQLQSQDGVHAAEDVTCGVLVIGLEDEFEEMRKAAIETIYQIAHTHASLRAPSLVFLLDMFNDEITSVSLKAIRAIRNLLRDHSQDLQLTQDQLESILVYLKDGNRNQRHALLECLGYTVVVGNEDVLGNMVNRMLAHMDKYPDDRAVVLNNFKELGARFRGSSEFFNKLFNYDPRYDPLPPLVTDIKYASIHILTYNALQKLELLHPQDAQKIDRFVPPYFFQHLRFFRAAFPRQYGTPEDDGERYWQELQERRRSHGPAATIGHLGASLEVARTLEELEAQWEQRKMLSVAWDKNPSRLLSPVGATKDKPLSVLAGLPVDLWTRAKFPVSAIEHASLNQVGVQVKLIRCRGEKDTDELAYQRMYWPYVIHSPTSATDDKHVFELFLRLTVPAGWKGIPCCCGDGLRCVRGGIDAAMFQFQLVQHVRTRSLSNQESSLNSSTPAVAVGEYQPLSDSIEFHICIK